MEQLNETNMQYFQIYKRKHIENLLSDKDVPITDDYQYNLP